MTDLHQDVDDDHVDLEPRDLGDDPDLLDRIDAANHPSPNGHRASPNRPPTEASTRSPNGLALARADDAEAGALGACLINPTAITDTLNAGLTAHHFGLPSNQLIWDAITTLHNQGQPADAVTVADTLARHGQLDRIGGPSRLVELQAAPAAVGSAGRYAQLIIDAARARRITTTATEAAHLATTNPDQALHLLHQLHTTGTDPARLEFEDVGAVLRGDYQPLIRAFLERTDGEALIYPGLLHWLFSPPGIGKTWLAIAAAAEAIRAGLPVLYLDWEGNRRLLGLRLAALGITAEQADQHFHYLRPGAVDHTLGHQLGTWAHDHHTALVIFDGFAKALAARNLDEDRAPDVLAYLNDAVDPLTRQGDGAAVLLLDHVTKDKEGRGLWPRGSGAKQGEVSGAAWSLGVRRAFNRHTPGVLELTQAKDREGEVGIDGQVIATVHLTPGADGRLDIRLEPPTTTSTGDGGFRPTRYMERISRWLEAENRFQRHPGRNDIVTEVEGKKAHLTTALAVLIDEGYVEVDATTKTHRHVSVRPYREADELPPIPDPDLDPEDEP